MSRRMLRNLVHTLSLAGLASVALCALVEQRANAVGVLEMRKIIGAPDRPTDADTKTINSYLVTDYFSKFTKPADGSTLAMLRRDYGNMVRGIGKTPGHDLLNQRAHDYANRVIGGGSRFTPMAKYNAMLLIADLNESDVPGAIKPYMPALGTMAKCLDIPPESDMAYLKQAALIGVTRLAEERAIPPNALPKVSDSLLKILLDADPPAGRSASAHNFMRRSAARALAAIGSPGPNNQVVTAMRSIMADQNARLTLRCEMAQYIGQLQIPSDAKVDYQDLANLIGHQTLEICEQEIDRALEEKREPSRRILLYALRSADTGLSGLSRSAEKNDEAAKFIAKIRSKVSQLHGQLDDVNKTPDSKIEDTLLPEMDTIRGLLLQKPQPPIAALSTPAVTEIAAQQPGQQVRIHRHTL